MVRTGSPAWAGTKIAMHTVATAKMRATIMKAVRQPAC